MSRILFDKAFMKQNDMRVSAVRKKIAEDRGSKVDTSCYRNGRLWLTATENSKWELEQRSGVLDLDTALKLSYGRSTRNRITLPLLQFWQA